MEELSYLLVTYREGDIVRLGFVLAALILLSTLSVASALVVKIPDASGAVGEAVDVPVVVEGAENLGSMDIVVAFDPAVLKVKSVGKGELNKGLLTSNTGEGVVAISLADSKGINGNGAVAVITFEVLKTGSSDLVIQAVKAYDVNTHVDIKVDTQNGKFTAKEGGGKSTPGFEVVAAIAGVSVALAIRKLNF